MSFQILLVRYFKAGFQTDVYYLALNVVNFILVIFTGFITDLYIPIYNDIKVRNADECKKFVGGVIVLMTVLGLAISIMAAILSPILTKLFASGFSYEKIAFSAKIIRILSIIIFFNSMTQLVNATLNANLFVKITYLSNFIPTIFNLVSLLLFVKSYGIMAIIYSLVIASIVNFLVVFIYVLKKVEWKVANPFLQPDIRLLLKKNLPIRAGVFIYQLQGPISINVLSYFPFGYITLFTYASNMLNIVLKASTSALTAVLNFNLSNLFSRKELEEAKNLLLSTLKNNVILLMLVLLPLLILFKEVIKIFFIHKLTIDQIVLMDYFFISLIPYYFTLCIEAPFATATIVLKNVKRVVLAALAFIITYTILLKITMKYFGFYSIAFSLFFAEFHATSIYVRFIHKKFHVLTMNRIRMFSVCAIFIGLFMSINLLFREHLYYSFVCNFILMLVWLIWAKNKIIEAFQFIMKKGIVK